MTTETLHIQLLGSFQFRAVGGVAVGRFTPRAQALLAFLVLCHEAPQPRAHVAGCLWPELSDAEALAQLCGLLGALGGGWPGVAAFLNTEGAALWWRSAVVVSSDVAMFEQALAEAAHAMAECRPDDARTFLEAAVACYGGDLLPACNDQWLLPARERLRQRLGDALAQLTRLQAVDRRLVAAAHA